MKKIMTAAIALILAISLTACGNLLDVRNAKEKTFDSNGLKITLTEAFKESEAEGFDVVIDSLSVALFAVKEPFDSFEGFGDLSLEEYADLVYQANSSKTPKEFEENDGVLCMEYNFYNEETKINYSYLSAVFKGPDAFWTVQFACDEKKYEDLKPDFIKWFKTVEISAQ